MRIELQNAVLFISPVKQYIVSTVEDFNDSLSTQTRSTRSLFLTVFVVFDVVALLIFILYV